MNKVFKVIWSEARNAYVVVSEIAKNHGSKSYSTKKLLAMLIATGVMTCASAAPAMAANLAPTETKIEIGEGASASGEGSVAIGEEAIASNLVAIAIGRDAVASGVDSIAIGSDTKATQTFSVAVGNDIGFTAYAGTAVGQQAYASGDNATAIGTMTNVDADYNATHDDWRKAGAQSTAIGAYAGSWGLASTAVGGFSKAEGKLATAIGYNSQANVDYGTALGDYSEVKAGWGVAIGASSFADRESHVVGLYAPDEDKDSLTWKANAGAVSVGSATITRQITNVAAGSADTDAVNVAQLNAVKAAAGKKVSLVDGENTKATLVKDDATGTQYKVDVDLSKYAKTEDIAVVYDKNKTSLRSTNAGVEDNSIALGKDTYAAKDSVAIGNGASVVAGSNGSSGVALGYKAHAGYKGTSLGSNAISGREGTTLVGANTNSGSLYTTVVGTDSVINSDGTTYKVNFMGIKKELNVQGATATVVGSKNTVDNKNGKVYSGVANNVMGSANTIEGSNGVTIQGTGNKVTDAYKDMNIGVFEAYDIGKGDYSALAKKKSGAVAVIGGANTVSKQTDSTVIGYDNKLTGDNEKGSHDVFMAGSHNELTNVSDSIVMGNENAITGVSNVISFGHQNTISADNAVAIGNGAGVIVEGGVALGVGSVASTDAGALGYGAAEGETGIAWKATNGAVSVGSSVEGKKITRQITNVAAGTADTDAVNVAQLKKVSEAAASASQGWKLKTQNGNASDVKPGATVEFDGDANIQVGNDGNKVSVTLKKQLTGIQSITGEGEGAGSISFADGGIKINNKVTINKDGKITGVAAGAITETSTDAVNGSQLHAVATEAGKHTTLSNGKNTTVNPVTTADGHLEYKVNVAGDLTDITSVANGDSKINLNKDSIIISNGNKYFAITNSGIGMSYIGADYSAKSIMLGENGTTISGGLNVAGSKITGVAAGEADTDAVNVSQLQKVSDTANAGWNLSTNGVATEATNVKPDDYVDFSGDKNISVSHDGTKVQVELNKNIDVNYVQTNALNAKYNLSVGTANENGTVPFLVTSTGAFYAANNNFSVDKDGKVIATAGEIGNVVLQNGVYTGNSALRDGELYVGDASGNYSQITTTGAKLGQVTIAADGKISGVAAGAVSKTSTDAINGSQLNQTNENVAALDKRVTQNEADIAQNKADIAQNKADIAQNKTDIKNLDNRVTNVEELAKKHTTVTAGDNIAVTESTNKDGGKEYKVALDKDINLDSVTTGQIVMNNDGLKVGKDVSVTATAVTAGKTSISDEGVKVGDKTYISDKGLNANDQKVTNVAAGKLSATSKDAVNGSQLYETNQAIANNATNISSLSHSISNLDNRVNKVGAGAAALAALHPLDFDPDAKWDFAAGYGNYRGANAAAVGAYYRPNEDTMFSVGGTFGNGENMVNVGVSFKLGSGSSHVSTSRVAMAKEIKELRGELEAMKSAMLDANAGKKIDTSKLQLFPDVPQNHWAYEYVAQLAGNGMIEGYPDGNFAGDRPMTRYEIAAILYRAMTKGAVLSDKILSEFSHELEYFTVDTIAKDKAGNPTIQRVRIVKENKNK